MKISTGTKVYKLSNQHPLVAAGTTALLAPALICMIPLMVLGLGLMVTCLPAMLFLMTFGSGVDKD